MSRSFAVTDQPSLSLSLLKPLVEKSGSECDVLYLNPVFRAMAGEEVYDRALALSARIDTYRWISPLEWVFGEVLFGNDWATSERAGIDKLLVDSHLDISRDTLDPEAYREALLGLRSQAGPFIRECISTVPWEDYDVVGFSISFPQVVSSLALGREIKSRYPEKIIALGGYHCQGSMGSALIRHFPFLDWVFNGQADISFPKALKRLDQGKNPEGIEGVTFRSDRGIIEQGWGESIDLDLLPHPDYQDFLNSLKRYSPEVLEEGAATLFAQFSRGCRWAERSPCLFCSFCVGLTTYRYMSPGRALKELEVLRERYGIKLIQITDLALPDAYFNTLLPALAIDPPVEFRAVEVRPNLTRERIKLMKSAGVIGFFSGIETLDSRIHRLMRKGTNLLQVLALLKWSREYDIPVYWNFLWGIPGETGDAYKRMSRLLPSLYHLMCPEDYRSLKLLRFSPFFYEHRELGIPDLKPIEEYKAIYPFDDDEIREIASVFEWRWEKNRSVYHAIRRCLGEMDKWIDSWSNAERPLLVYRRQSEGRLKIYDTRPTRGAPTHILEGEVALAYLACDSPTSFTGIAEITRKKMPGTYPGDISIRKALDRLVKERLMVRERDHYLALANDLDIMKDYCHEFAVQMLAGLQ
jgi:ribosomal peptide maturation radical SAM protein 1